MKYDFEANETMKRLGRCRPIYKGSPEGDELLEFFEGIGIEPKGEIFHIVMLAYMLGRSRKNRREVTRS